MYFSIIIPVYNVEKYLHECLDSVLGQSFQDWEAVCVNDGSTDDSASILKDYSGKDNRFRIVDQSNSGLSVARNTGMIYSTGKYVLFLDSDDWLEKDALQTLADNISDEDMLCFNGRRFFEERGQFENADQLEPAVFSSGWEYYGRNALCHRSFAFVCVVLRCYRKDFLLKYTLRFKPGIYHEDNLFTPLACYHAKGVKVIPDILYDYRVRESSIMTTQSIKHKEDIIGIANDLASFFVPKTDIEKKTIYRSLVHHYQRAFFDKVSRKDEKHLRSLVNWSLCRSVSRTKLRHRVQFFALRISPALFRSIVNIF